MVGHEWFTSPGRFSERMKEFPADLSEIFDCLNNLFIHVWDIQENREERVREHQVFIRRFENLLAAVVAKDPRPLHQHRDPNSRVVVDCRNFALALCSILLDRGLQARLRSGFATYLEDSHFQDHWICEYWDVKTKGWARVDPDVGRVLRPGEFLTACEAWDKGQKGEIGWNKFGYSPDLLGRWAVRLNLTRDIQSLLGWIAVSGDSFGVGAGGDDALVDGDWQDLDAAVALALDPEMGRDKLAEFVANHAGFQVPETVRFYDYVHDQSNPRLEWKTEP